MASNISFSTKDKLNFFSNFGTMLSAGIPILETMEALMEGSKGNQAKIFTAIREDLIQGKHLYEAMANFPKAFDLVTVNIIKASEEAGTLETTLKDIRIEIKKDMEFNDRVKSALTYPIIIFSVFLGVLTMILVVVVPKISTVFLRMKATLPLPTKILIFISQALLTYTIPILVGIALLIIGTVFLYRAQKKYVLGFLFSLPLVEKLIKEIDLTRFSRSMYLLLTSGITINSALELCEHVVMRRDIGRAVVHAKEVILSGKKLSEGFIEQKNIFSSIMIKIIEAGEKTGTLDKSMQEISEYLDYEVSNTLKTLTTLLEPLMLVFIGIMVGGMMLAIIAPIYGLIGNLGH
ncbi:MAG TPA: type II secretion system F family protein [Candidatus Eisenbacteria bacterium]|nr:type II secretion system F family protein [Candidatus Eisenbacteria bacterium]